MKYLLIVLVLIISSNRVLSQSKIKDYEPIDKVGWEIKEFVIPENLKDPDSGEVNYLLTLSEEGVVKDLEILSNTFNRKAEAKLRKEVKRILFARKLQAEDSLKYKGVLSIKREPCSKVDNKAG